MTATCRSTALQRIRVVAFPRQQWLRERATILRNSYILFFVLPKNGPGLAKGDNRIFWETGILADFLNLDRSNKEEFSRYFLTFGSLEGCIMLWTRRYESGGNFF
jgi:hypothetical protein